MCEQSWTRTSDKLPPEDVVVRTMDSSGNVQRLLRYRNLWFFEDKSAYVYYTPIFWQEIT